MTTHPHNSGEDKRTHEAWERLQTKLATEPVNDKWETWGTQGKQNGLQLAGALPGPAVSAAASNEASQPTTEAPAPAKTPAAGQAAIAIG